MIIHAGTWKVLQVSCEQFVDLAHDAVMPLEFALQDGETKLQIDSSKRFNGEKLELLPDNRTQPYCIHIRGIESMVLSSDGHPDLFVEDLQREENEFRILGSNGRLSFSGKSLLVEFLASGHNE